MTKLEKLCIKWLNENYSHMVPFIMKEHPDYIFHMKDGKCILQHNKKNGYVYVSYREIWKFFESYFSMSDQQIKDITKIWVEEQYKMGVTSTTRGVPVEALTVEEQYKMGVTSPLFFKYDLPFKVEEHYKMGVTSISKFPYLQEQWAEEHYKMGVTSIQEFGWRLQKQVDEQYKMGVTSTMVDYKEITNQAEEQYKEITISVAHPHFVRTNAEKQYKEILTTSN